MNVGGGSSSSWLILSESFLALSLHSSDELGELSQWLAVMKTL